MNARILSVLFGWLLPVSFSGLTATAAELQTTKVTNRGPHHRTWQTVAQATKADGTPYLRTNSYVQLENGAHYKNARGEWVESEETIEIVNGIGLAEKTPHKVQFPASIRGEIQLITPDSKLFRSRITFIAYTDSRTGQSVLIAEPKDSIGVVADNRVVYEDAFTDFLADVRYTYTKAGLEQDVIFLQNPPRPEEYGLNSETTRLEIFTEFLEAPVPEKRSSILVEETDALRRQGASEPDLSDEFLDFGVMSIGIGKAFPATAATEENSTLVGKQWTLISGRTFLIEKLDYRSVRAGLQQLPPAAVIKRPSTPVKREALLAEFPLRQQDPSTGKNLQLAWKRPEAKGFVLDYQIVSSASNYVFKADTTYLVTNAFTLSGTTVVEGGSVIKFTPYSGSGPRLLVTGPVDCQTGPGRPAFFIPKDDDTIGDSIAGSTGTPGGDYAHRAMQLSYSGTVELHDLRFRWCHFAIEANSGTKLILRHSQIAFGFGALLVSSGPLQLRNVLIHSVTNGISCTATSEVEHVTFHKIKTFWTSPTSDRVRLTNCLLISITNSVVFGGANVVTNIDDTGFFQTVGGGSYYLAADSTNRLAGTTNINPALLADLKQRTTYPPVLLTNDITNTTVLSIQAGRGSDPPDLGYAYDPLDFVVKDVDVSAALTIQPGTAIGIYGASGSYGLQLTNGGSLVCEGRVTEPCRIARYNMIQEQASSNWAAPSVGYSISTPASDMSPQPTARFRFTEFSMPAAGAEHLFAGFDDIPPIVFRDCEFGGGKLYFDYPGAIFTNCLFDRVDSTIVGESVQSYNSLFYGGALTLSQFLNPYVFTNNVFDKTAISQNGTVGHDYNGYITNATAQWLTNSGTHNVFTNTFTWQNSGLWRFYQPTNSIFIGRGSTNADLLTLYHYTVLTNNVKETNSIVDLGFHRVAMSGSSPVDSDGDGLPDYLEDLDGDGTVDSGEGDFAVVDTDGDGVSDYLEWLQGRRPRTYGTIADTNGIVNLRVFTPNR